VRVGPGAVAARVRGVCLLVSAGARCACRFTTEGASTRLRCGVLGPWRSTLCFVSWCLRRRRELCLFSIVEAVQIQVYDKPRHTQVYARGRVWSGREVGGWYG